MTPLRYRRPLQSRASEYRCRIRTRQSTLSYWTEGSLSRLAPATRRSSRSGAARFSKLVDPRLSGDLRRLPSQIHLVLIPVQVYGSREASRTLSFESDSGSDAESGRPSSSAVRARKGCCDAKKEPTRAFRELSSLIKDLFSTSAHFPRRRLCRLRRRAHRCRLRTPRIPHPSRRQTHRPPRGPSSRR